MNAAPEPSAARVAPPPPRRTIIRRRDLLVLAVVAAGLAGAEALARASRHELPGATLVRCEGPEGVERAWRAAPVRGRTLVHVARQPAMHTDPDAPIANAYVYRAVRAGVVRRVFHVVPEAAWPEVAENLRSVVAAWPEGRTFRIVVEGTPIVVLRLSDLPALEETVLVDVDVGASPPEELAALAARLARREPAADLVAWYGAASLPAALEAVGARAR